MGINAEYMGTLHTVRYRQPQTYQVYQKDHNGLLTHIGSPGGCLPHGPLLRLLLRRLPRLRLRSGRRLRWIRWIRFGLVGSWTWLRISRPWSWLWLRIGRLWTRTRCRHCPSYWHRPCRSGNWNWQSLLIQITTRSIFLISDCICLL